MALNKYFLVHADHHRYVVFTSEYVDTTYHIKTVKTPLDIFGQCKIVGNGKAENIHIDIYNQSDARAYKTQMTRMKRCIYVRGLGKIYEYKITNLNPCLPLPEEFYEVYIGKDVSCSFHLCLHPEPIKAVIPAHVLKGFVNGLILAKETCPITLDELKIGDIALTGCYHAFSKDALDAVLPGACPSCRAKLSKKKITYH